MDVKVLTVCGGLIPNEATFCYIWGLQSGVQKYLEGKEPRKIIVANKRLVNVVV